MGLFKSHMFLALLLFLICLAIQETSSAEARPLPFQHQSKPAIQETSSAEARPLPFQHQSYSKTFATLGVLCKCCDGVAGDSGGEESCTTSWDGSCSKLHCLSWKLQ